MRKNIYTLLFSLFFVLNSCITPQYVTNITSHGKLENTRKKTATLVGLDRVFIHDYKKTFHKNFENNTDWSQKFLQSFSNTLVNHNLFSEVTIDNLKDWNHINTMTSKKSYLKVESLFEKCESDYLIFIDEFDFRQKITTSGSNYNSATGMQTTNSSEFLILKATIKIFDTKSHAPLIEFDVFGEDQILFFTYSKSLLDARKKLIENIATYLESYK